MKRGALTDNRIAIRAATLAAGLLCALPVAAQAEEGQSSGLPQLDPSTYTSQVFWLAVTFVIMYALVKSLILPRLERMVEGRAGHVKGDTDTAAKAKTGAEAARQAYEKLMVTARADATRLLAEANESAKAKAAAELQALRERSSKEAAALDKKLITAKNQAKLEMQTICAEIAADISARIIGVKTDVNAAKTVIQSIKNSEAA